MHFIRYRHSTTKIFGVSYQINDRNIPDKSCNDRFRFKYSFHTYLHPISCVLCTKSVTSSNMNFGESRFIHSYSSDLYVLISKLCDSNASAKFSGSRNRE